MSSDSSKERTYAGVTPVLIVNNGDKALKFYEQALGAKTTYRFDTPDGKVMHAEFEVSGTKIMLGEMCDKEGGMQEPNALGGSPVSLYVYVDDADAVFKKAVSAGAKSIMEPMDMFYGDRMGQLRDPFGHFWNIAKHVHDISDGEIKKAAEEMFRQNKAA